MEADRVYIKKALRLAEAGRGKVSPNPLVGAMLVRDGEVIGAGFHATYGKTHAEVAAIEDCRARGESPIGATLYVTLEPCAHHGRQPPCTEAILDAGISRVVFASEDPSEHASGAGPDQLIMAEVEVQALDPDDEQARAARLLNQPFLKHAVTGRPHVALKLAMTLDGRVTAPGDGQRWISGEASRALVHAWRADADAIAVGVGTALADDPLLTARGKGTPRQPLRVVFDSDARLGLDSQLVRTVGDAPLVVVTDATADPAAVDALEEAGVEVLRILGPDYEDRVEATLDALGERPVTSLLLEGGPRLASAFLEAGEVDEMRLFYAPALAGGGEARAGLEGAGVTSIGSAARTLEVEWEPVGEDMLARARLREW